MDMYMKTYTGLFLLQLQTVHSRSGNIYIHEIKIQNITTSTNASRDLLITQATTTIMIWLHTKSLYYEARDVAKKILQYHYLKKCIQRY